MRRAIDQMENQIARQNLIQTMLRIAHAEASWLTATSDQRQLIGFSILVTEKTVLKVLQVGEGGMKVVYQSEKWIKKQVGTTRWYTVGRVGSDEAFLLYDATGQGQEAADAVAAVRGTLEKIERGSSKRGVVFIGDPTSREYQRLKKEFEDAGVFVVGQVDIYDRSQHPPRPRSQDEILRATDETVQNMWRHTAIAATRGGAKAITIRPWLTTIKPSNSIQRMAGLAALALVRCDWISSLMKLSRIVRRRFRLIHKMPVPMPSVPWR